MSEGEHEVRTSQKRPVKALGALSLREVTPGVAEAAAPHFEWVDPGDLVVDERYQRQLSERSVNLVRRIVARWDWRRFKPPVVARTADGFEVIDGQHTAIAAATHPDIAQIPVMVVAAGETADRAGAFIGHNRDRINVTPLQMHFAALAAGDDDAQTVEQVCGRAGVKVLRGPPGNGVFKPGDTMAVTTIRAICNRRGAQKARIILETVAKAEATPVREVQILAVELLLHGEEYRGEVSPDDLTSALIALGEGAEAEAKLFATAHRVPQWRALAAILFRRARRGRRRAD